MICIFTPGEVSWLVPPHVTCYQYCTPIFSVYLCKYGTQLTKWCVIRECMAGVACEGWNRCGVTSLSVMRWLWGDNVGRRRHSLHSELCDVMGVWIYFHFELFYCYSLSRMCNIDPRGPARDFWGEKLGLVSLHLTWLLLWLTEMGNMMMMMLIFRHLCAHHLRTVKCVGGESRGHHHNISLDMTYHNVTWWY